MLRILAFSLITAVAFAVDANPLAAAPPRQKPSSAARAPSPTEAPPRPESLGAGTPTSPAAKKEARVIPLDETQARTFHTIIVHPSIPAILEFPEPFLGAPSCGDCVDGSTPPDVLKGADALFLFDLFSAEQYISIKPAQYSKRDGGRVPDENFLTTLTVRLQSKVTLTLRIQYGTMDTADARVVFTLPNRGAETQFVKDQIAKAKAQLEATYADRVSEGVKREFVRAFLEPHSCAPSTRRERNENIVVEVQEICRFGSRGFIRFTIENRHKIPFLIGELQVALGRGQAAVPAENVFHLFASDAREVAFRVTVAGVVGFDVPERTGDTSYELQVAESDGKGRKVVVSELKL
jgi:hypothetical protein